MTTEAFIEKTFRGTSLAMIEVSNEIIADYQAQGFTLTLRQLYYQLVARDLFPEDRKWRWTGTAWVRDDNGTKNAQPNYKWFGNIINDGRMAGLVDWEAIEDRLRNVRDHPTWESPMDIVHAAAQSFALDLWADQDYRPEVWIEKDALVGVIEPVCNRFQVPYFACRGYTSQSETWRAGKRFARQGRGGQQPIVFHLGDHDPSGIDMTRDNSERLALFSDETVILKRLALNFDQIEEFNPPPNPAKETDSRSAGYRTAYGDSSWELDALDPRVIDAMIARELEELLDRPKFDAARERQESERQILLTATDRWEDIKRFLDEQE